MSRLRAALLALERGLEFIVHSDLVHQSLIVQSDISKVGSEILGPSHGRRRPVTSDNLNHLIGQFDALRIMRVDSREIGGANALVQLSMAQFEIYRRAFDICDDRGLMEYVSGGSGIAASDKVPEPAFPWTDPYFALPFDTERLRKVLEGLRFREREMIRLRNPEAGGRVYKLGEIGCIFKISRERVRQILDQGMRRLWALAARAEPWR